MSILASQRERDSTAGYARDFVEVVHSLIPFWQKGSKVRVISNAGGLNPHGCAKACAEVLRQAGIHSMKIGVVTGDDVLPVFKSGPAKGARSNLFANLETGEPLTKVLGSLVTASAYLGAQPIAEALKTGADIVITGRVADPSLTVAPCVAEFGWDWNDHDRIAGATIAGHLIECGTQVTGGISTDWLAIPDPANIGFPIVEVSSDGTCVVTKPKLTGGVVSERTVKEQLLYEIGDPDSYLSPDVTVSFLSLQVREEKKNRVRVSGARGRSPTSSYKVSASYRDGFWAQGMLTVFGRDAVAKARRSGGVILQRVRQAGHELQRSSVECVGADACMPGLLDKSIEAELLETVLRVTVADPRREAVERFTKEMSPLICGGPQGVTGYAAGRPRVHEVFGYWPCLIDKREVNARVDILTCEQRSAGRPGPQRPPTKQGVSSFYDVFLPSNVLRAGTSRAPAAATSSKGQIRLGEIAYARSGDKGSSANVGVIARTPQGFALLRSYLSAARVEKFFKPLGVGKVIRYELPNLGALNFLLPGVLAGGASRSLRTDAQGKTLGQAILEMKLTMTKRDLARCKERVLKVPLVRRAP